jgi:hypothetical protein
MWVSKGVFEVMLAYIIRPKYFNFINGVTMKKIILSMIGLLAATAFAPQASAIPSFARQTGMACMACHQQHFPVLNSFGQSFKANGYTMMGSQGVVEGEHLSLPDTLNASMLLKARYQQTNGDMAVGELSGQTTNDGQWQIPDEFSLFFGGRVNEHAGFMFEGNTAASPLVAGFKMPMVLDLGAAKLLAIPYLTDALGTSYGFEQASTGAVRGVRWAEHRKEISAQQYIGTDGAATGVAIVAHTDMGYINYSMWSPNFTASAGSGAIQLKSSYIRAAFTPTVADWAMHIGVQSWSGENYVDGGIGGTLVGNPATFELVKTEATAVDFQAFGKVADKDLAVYATYATAPGTDAADTVVNSFNVRYNAAGVLQTTLDETAMTIGADFSVLPGVLTIGAAYRTAENGRAVAGDPTKSQTDDAMTLTVVYDLSQNVALHVNHSAYSGTKYDTVQANGDSLTTFLLEAAW